MSCCRATARPAIKHHTARATLLARIALPGRGIQIQPDPLPPPSHGECRKLVRDALRLWRSTGSIGGGWCLKPLPVNESLSGSKAVAVHGSEESSRMPSLVPPPVPWFH